MNIVCLSRLLALGLLTALICACTQQKQPRWVAVEEVVLPPAADFPLAPVDKATLQLASLKTTKPQVIEPAVLPARQADELAQGFLVKIECFQDPAISGSYRISEDGTLKLPYQVQLKAAGMTASQLQQELVQQYREFFRGPPRINASIEERKFYVDVQGLVNQPGKFLVSDGSSLDELVSQAGGLQRGYDGKPSALFVRISQAEASRIIRLSDYYAGANIELPSWYGGDKVFFQAEGDPNSGPLSYNPQAVQILGQVRNPGEYSYRENGDLFYYIGQAGGLTDRADLNNLMLVRTSGDRRLAYNFTMEQIQYLPQIGRGDILFVHADNLGSAEKTTRVLSEIGQFFGSVATSILLLIAL